MDTGEGEQEGGPDSQHLVPGALTAPSAALTLHCEFSTGHQWIPSRVSGKTRSTRVFPGAPTSHILTEPRTAVSSAPPPPLLRDCGMTRLSSACAWWRASVDVEKPPFPSRVFPEVQSSAPGKSRTPFKARGRVSPTRIYHHRCLGCVLKPIISTFCTKKKTG